MKTTPSLPADVRGFTLVELMVTLAILAILVAMAAPAIDRQIRVTRLNADVEKLQAALAYTRSEARKRSAPVSLVPNSGDYSQGWQIITDDATDQPDCVKDADEELLRVQEQVSPGVEIIIGNTNSDGSVNCSAALPNPYACTSFARQGDSIRPQPALPGMSLQTFCVRDTKTPTLLYRALTINASGEVYLAKVSNQ